VTTTEAVAPAALAAPAAGEGSADIAAQLDDFGPSRNTDQPIQPVKAVKTGRKPRTARRRWATVLIVPTVVATVVTGGAWAYQRATAPEPPTPLGPGEVTIELGVEHSLFTTDELRVYEGTRVRFVLDNGDPINHELIMGDAAVHARHASGTEMKHAPIPGEVSVSPNDRAVTTFRFDEPGTVEFACHLPGHYEYGMHGTIEVVERA
jgi:uncharacterized cupredoxin-like copper-binding protein